MPMRRHTSCAVPAVGCTDTAIVHVVLVLRVQYRCVLAVGAPKCRCGECVRQWELVLGAEIDSPPRAPLVQP